VVGGFAVSKMKHYVRIFLGLGSNIGDRAGQIKDAVGIIKSNPHFRNVRVSRFYESSPVGPKQRDFVNAVLRARTDMPVMELLSFIKDVEKKLGRKKRMLMWGPRDIDIDILFFGSKVLKKKELKIPHAELAKRLFVLVPLGDIAPGFRHPVLKKTVSAMKKELLLTSPEQKVKILKTVKR